MYKISDREKEVVNKIIANTKRIWDNLPTRLKEPWYKYTKSIKRSFKNT